MERDISETRFNRSGHAIRTMLRLLLFSGCLSLTFAEFLYAGNDCDISIQHKNGDLRLPQPLVLTGNSKNRDFLYPEDDKRTLKIRAGESIYLACPGKYNYLQNLGNRQEATAVCIRDKIFSIGGVPRNFSSLTCKYTAEHNARRMESGCLGEHRSISIGFQLNSTFLETIEVCRDDETFVTYYTKFKLSKGIGSYQTGYPRPTKWWVGDFYPKVDVVKSYKPNNQIYTIARILNSTELAKDRIDKDSQYLSRGHMTAKSDFVYGSQQRSTFWHLNAAPQWLSFNAGNWNSLEQSVRKFAGTRRLDLDVYTGVHGQMTMKDVHGKHQPIYLYDDGKKRSLPAPKFYWKIIYDPVSKRGTAFVGLNDPFIESITDDIYICKDISSKINWLTWSRNNIKLGISYTCTVDDLRKAVPTTPKLDVIDLLI